MPRLAVTITGTVQGVGFRPYVFELAHRLGLQVAPRNAFLGVMLAYTPLHQVLLRELRGLPLVMTSGNRADGPIEPAPWTP